MNPHTPQTVIAHAARHAELAPDRPAVISDAKVLSYGDLWHNVRRYAHTLQSKGVGAGDCVVVSAAATADFVLVYLAVHLCGAIAVPIDPASPKARVDDIAHHTAPKLAIIGRKIGLPETEELTIKEIDAGSSNEAPGKASMLPAPSKPADILFTSGTTGQAKGVVLTHGNLYHAARNINTFIGNTENDVEVLPLPLCHSFGLARLRCHLVTGGCIRLVSGFTFPQLIFNAMGKDTATGMALVPAGIAILMKHDSDQLHAFRDQLRYIEIGSAPMPMAHKHKLMALLPKTRICMHYGLTEASRSTFIEFHADQNKIASIGKPAPNVDIKIVDNRGKDMPAEQSGTIWVKGEMVMKEYYRNPQLTRKVMRKGWLNTGDWGHADSEGYLFLEGREKELINVGGRKVAPLEVEALLNSHAGVKESACIAIPDPKGITGEAIKAYIVPDPNAPKPAPDAEILAFLRRRLEPYKIPSKIEWVAKIKKTASGKIQRLQIPDNEN